VGFKVYKVSGTPEFVNYCRILRGWGGFGRPGTGCVKICARYGAQIARFYEPGSARTAPTGRALRFPPLGPGAALQS